MTYRSHFNVRNARTSANLFPCFDSIIVMIPFYRLACPPWQLQRNNEVIIKFALEIRNPLRGSNQRIICREPYKVTCFCLSLFSVLRSLLPPVPRSLAVSLRVHHACQQTSRENHCSQRVSAALKFESLLVARSSASSF